MEVTGWPPEKVLSAYAYPTPTPKGHGDLKIKNWDDFMPYRNRRSGWIKLPCRLLSDSAWHALTGEDAKVLVMLWLVATEDPEMEGKLPPLPDLALRLRMPEEQLKEHLLRLEPQWLDRCESRSGEAPQQATEEQTGNPEATSAGPEAGSPAPE